VRIWWIIILGIISCDRDPFIRRVSEDYFPLEKGKEWVYVEQNSRDTLKVNVVGNIDLLAKCGWVVEYNGEPYYWAKNSDKIEKYFSQEVVINGKRRKLGEWWVDWLRLPFIEGKKWKKEVQRKKSIAGDTVKVRIKVEGEVKKKIGNQFVIKLNLVKEVSSKFLINQRDSTTYQERYAPNIGLVEQTIGKDKQYILINYK
jgi:hypothetical protein